MYVPVSIDFHFASPIAYAWPGRRKSPPKLCISKRDSKVIIGSSIQSAYHTEIVVRGVVDEPEEPDAILHERIVLRCLCKRHRRIPKAYETVTAIDRIMPCIWHSINSERAIRPAYMVPLPTCPKNNKKVFLQSFLPNIIIPYLITQRLMAIIIKKVPMLRIRHVHAPVPMIKHGHTSKIFLKDWGIS